MTRKQVKVVLTLMRATFWVACIGFLMHVTLWFFDPSWSHVGNALFALTIGVAMEATIGWTEQRMEHLP